MQDYQLGGIVSQFGIKPENATIVPLGNGLINTTYKVTTSDQEPAYVLQRINHNVFPDVDMLMNNVVAVTTHLHSKLAAQGYSDEEIRRRCLHFLPLADGSGKYYYKSGEDYWRIMEYIAGTVTLDEVNPQSANDTGKAFGNFEAMLADISAPMGETIKDFHNMEFRMQQLREAVEADAAHRADSVKALILNIESYADEMTMAERLYREHKLPKRICHCDTKVNNMLFDATTGEVLCVIDLDTVMPSFVFSDFGDFLRSAANTAAEDEPDLSRVEFNIDIFKAFTQGYLETAGAFLTDVEIENLPYAARLFPFMQAVRFLTDYINGDTYYRIQYPEHNLVRTKAQYKLFESATAQESQMQLIVKQLSAKD